MKALTQSAGAQTAAETQWLKFNDDYLLERAESPGRIQVRYACVDDAIARLQLLVTRERFRASRVEWDTEVLGHHLTLTVTGDEDSIVAVRRLLR